jgi:hypothetical protein
MDWKGKEIILKTEYLNLIFCLEKIEKIVRFLQLRSLIAERWW